MRPATCRECVLAGSGCHILSIQTFVKHSVAMGHWQMLNYKQYDVFFLRRSDTVLVYLFAALPPRSELGEPEGVLIVAC